MQMEVPRGCDWDSGPAWSIDRSGFTDSWGPACWALEPVEALGDLALTAQPPFELL